MCESGQCAALRSRCQSFELWMYHSVYPCFPACDIPATRLWWLFPL